MSRTPWLKGVDIGRQTPSERESVGPQDTAYNPGSQNTAACNSLVTPGTLKLLLQAKREQYHTPTLDHNTLQAEGGIGPALMEQSGASHRGLEDFETVWNHTGQRRWDIGPIPADWARAKSSPPPLRRHKVARNVEGEVLRLDIL
ncbi:unnamed protein product [Boreogadus saida]